jgi:hypothetical protein
MSAPASRGESDPLAAELLEELAAKLQAGEPLDLEACIQKHPEYAERLRRLLPTVQVLAELGRSGASVQPSVANDGLTPGILGDFRIVREIGCGGMGVVYEAEQISLGRRVALKVLPFASTLDAKQLQRFKNEAQAAAGLHHTNIVPVFATGCERGVHYYAMQFIEGQTLAQIIADLRLRIADWKKEGTDHSMPSQPPPEAAPTGPYTPEPIAQSAIRNPQWPSRRRSPFFPRSAQPKARPTFARSLSSACKPPKRWSTRTNSASCTAT